MYNGIAYLYTVGIGVFAQPGQRSGRRTYYNAFVYFEVADDRAAYVLKKTRGGCFGIYPFALYGVDIDPADSMTISVKYAGKGVISADRISNLSYWIPFVFRRFTLPILPVSRVVQNNIAGEVNGNPPEAIIMSRFVNKLRKARKLLRRRNVV